MKSKSDLFLLKIVSSEQIIMYEVTPKVAAWVSAQISESQQWMKFETAKGADVTINKSNVIAFDIEEYFKPDKPTEPLAGVSVREICKAAPSRWKYPTLVRKVNRPGGITLEMASPRRVLLCAQNFVALELSNSEIRKLKAIEDKRLAKK